MVFSWTLDWNKKIDIPFRTVILYLKFPLRPQIKWYNKCQHSLWSKLNFLEAEGRGSNFPLKVGLALLYKLVFKNCNLDSSNFFLTAISDGQLSQIEAMFDAHVSCWIINELCMKDCNMKYSLTLSLFTCFSCSSLFNSNWIFLFSFSSLTT